MKGVITLKKNRFKKDYADRYADLTDAQKHLVGQMRSSHNYKIILEQDTQAYILYYGHNLVRVLNHPTVEKLLKLGFLRQNNYSLKAVYA